LRPTPKWGATRKDKDKDKEHDYAEDDLWGTVYDTQNMDDLSDDDWQPRRDGKEENEGKQDWGP